MRSLTDTRESDAQPLIMASAEENEALKANFQEQLQKVKDEHEKEVNQMREDYGFVIATLKLGSSSDAIIELQAKINEQEHEMESIKMECNIEKANLVNKFKRAESTSMFALRRNEEMSNKIYAMQIELEEMDDKHQAEIESYEEKLSALGDEKVKNKDTEKQGGNLKNKRKLMKKELEELRNEHERKMESFANKIQDEKNGDLQEMTEKISRHEKLIDGMKLSHIRAIKTLEESHRDEKVVALINERQRVQELEAECLTLKVGNEKKIEDLKKEHKEEMDKLRKYYEQEIGALKRRKVSKSQALRRKTSVDTASLILKALKEQNERDEKGEIAKKSNLTMETNIMKHLPQTSFDDMDLQKSMEKIRITYSEEFRKPTTVENPPQCDKLKQLTNERDALTKRLKEVEEAHKNEMNATTGRYTEMMRTFEKQKINLKNNENEETSKSENNENKNETNKKEYAVNNIKESIQRFDQRMQILRVEQTSPNKEEGGKSEEILRVEQTSPNKEEGSKSEEILRIKQTSPNKEEGGKSEEKKEQEIETQQG